MIACMLPKLPSNNLIVSLTTGKDTIGKDAALLLAVLNSFPADYFARLKISENLLKNVLFEVPMPSSPEFLLAQTWPASNSSLADGTLSRILELTYTAWDLAPFAQDCGWSGPPFRWDEERRFLLRCELDAAFFHLYLPAEASGDWRHAEGETAEDLARLKASFPTPREAVAYIMDTFPIVRRKDEQKFDGDYRTKRVILEIYDAMQGSVRTGQPYQTRLDPPPGPPAVSLPDWQPGHPRPYNWPPNIHPPRGHSW